MRRIILCEGETDATLIGLYLGKMCGWTYTKREIIKIPKKFPSDNKKANHYCKGDDILVICSVGGKDSFGSFFEEYIYKMIKSFNKEEDLYRIALITDADNRKIDEIETDILTQLSFCIKNVSNNVWTSNSVKVDFDDNVTVDFLLSVVPPSSAGALENILLDALSEKAEGNSIVDASVRFINDLPYYSYIPTDRLKLKAKLGVALSVIYPDKVFSQFDEQLHMVDWSKSKTISECFKELINI